MPRVARVVFPGFPHHIVQRGNRRATVFFNDGDRRTYLAWLREYCGEHGLEIIAYCLMTNHVHLVAIPATLDTLHRTFKPLHSRYASRINKINGWSGHVWQGRPYSSVLDEAYFWNAIRYVERNPVRAGLVRKCEDYPWSSAGAHCGLRTDALLTADSGWRAQLASIKDWPEWLVPDDPPEALDTLRSSAANGWACGSVDFVEARSREAGKPLGPRPKGRPKK